MTVRLLHRAENGKLLLFFNGWSMDDTLFEGCCGRTDLPGGDGAQMLASLKRLAELPGDYHVLPGHGEDTTLDRERRTNYYMREAMRV